MSAPKTKKAYIVRDFNDAGTGQKFKAKATVDIEEGQHANYLAAGLIREPGTETAKSAS